MRTSNEGSLTTQLMLRIKKIGGFPKRPVAGHTGRNHVESNESRGVQSRNIARSCEQGQQFGESQAMRLGRRRQNAAAGRRFAARAFLWRGRRWLILLRAMRA